MQKREKSFGKTLSLASGCMNAAFSVCLVFCDGKFQHLCVEDDAFRSDLLLLPMIDHLTCSFIGKSRYYSAEICVLLVIVQQRRRAYTRLVHVLVKRQTESVKSVIGLCR